ncbi:MAG: alanine racemase [Tepidanaerobacteraceae bacterium]|nr:alanine racemase [Tepidanaerobacteraceae bacterium]
MEKNLKDIAIMIKSKAKKIRPHIKTHKIPELAKLQIELGAKGITAAKVSEAEVMAAHGIDDILIANQVVDRQKLDRLVDLAKKARLSVLVDSQEGLIRLADAVKNADVKIGVYIEIDTGDKRCGIPPEKASEFAKEIIRHKNLEFIGIETYGARLNHFINIQQLEQIAMDVVNTMITVKTQIERNGIKVKEISIGGTPGVVQLAQLDGPTELRPGVYIFNDVATVFRKAVGFRDCALTVLSTVISKSGNRMIVDAGGKSLSYARPGIILGEDTYYGVIKGMENLGVKRVSEEHGVFEEEESLNEFVIGEKIEIIPAHACPVVNLFNEIYCHRNGAVEKILKISARGKVE